MLLTSTNEGLHGTAVESLYLNTPVVSTDSKGIRDVLTDELKNFICKNKYELIQKSKIALKNYPAIDQSKIKQKFGFAIIQKYISLMER